jgi:uncharacterized protein YceK
MTESRRLLNLAAPFIGGLLALLAALLLCGCSTIRDAAGHRRGADAGLGRGYAGKLLVGAER